MSKGQEIAINWELFRDIYQYEHPGMTKKEASIGAKKIWGKGKGINQDSLNAVLEKKRLKKAKAPRKPTEYNKFIAKEMKKGKTMKEAAFMWRNKK